MVPKKLNGSKDGILKVLDPDLRESYAYLRIRAKLITLRIQIQKHREEIINC